MGAGVAWRRDATCSRSRGCSFALAAIHTVVLVAVDPLRTGELPIDSRRSSRTPSSSGSSSIVSTFVLDEKFLTTSAVGAVVSDSRCRTHSATCFRAWPSRSRSRSTSATGVFVRLRRRSGRDHVARDEDPDAAGQPRDRAQQRGRETVDHELLGAGGAHADFVRDRRELRNPPTT